MNSLRTLVNDSSSELGFELSLEKSNDNRSLFEIRFAQLTPNRSFFLSISRSWKTTRIEYISDPFAQETSTYLLAKYLENENQIGIIVNRFREDLSDYFLPDFLMYGDLNSVKTDSTQSFEFSAEVMTAESSIAHGLVNDEETTIVKFALSLLAFLLPQASVAFVNPDEVKGFPEGAVTQVLVNKYERDPRNRRAAIAIHGMVCMACGFDFEKTYGELGSDYIVVHHTVPVSKLESDYLINPETDLVTICANCHAMIHREDPPMSLEQLRKNIKV